MGSGFVVKNQQPRGTLGARPFAGSTTSCRSCRSCRKLRLASSKESSGFRHDHATKTDLPTSIGFCFVLIIGTLAKLHQTSVHRPCWKIQSQYHVILGTAFLLVCFEFANTEVEKGAFSLLFYLLFYPFPATGHGRPAGRRGNPGAGLAGPAPLASPRPARRHSALIDRPEDVFGTPTRAECGVSQAREFRMAARVCAFQTRPVVHGPFPNKFLRTALAGQCCVLAGEPQIPPLRCPCSGFLIRSAPVGSPGMPRTAPPHRWLKHGGAGCGLSPSSSTPATLKVAASPRRFRAAADRGRRQNLQDSDRPT